MTCCKARFFRFYLQIIEYFWKIYKNCSFFQRKPKSLNFKVFQKFVKIKWSNPFLIVYFKFVKFKLNRSKSQRYGHFLKIHYRDSYGFLRLMLITSQFRPFHWFFMGIEEIWNFFGFKSHFWFYCFLDISF